MTLVDTSVWVRHFRSRHSALVSLLDENRVAVHDFVVGKLACGQLKHRREILSLLQTLPRLDTLPHDDVLFLIQGRKLFGSGIGWIDSHLLASTIDAGYHLWTLDKSLQNATKKCGVHFQ